MVQRGLPRGPRADGGGEVLPHREARKDAAPFRHQAEPELGDAERGQPAQLSALERDASAVRRRHPHDRADGRGLAHAVAPEQRHHLAAAHLEVDPEQDLALAVAGLEPLNRQHRGLVVLFAEIGHAHAGMVSDLVRGSGRDDAAADQNRNAVGEREHDVHVVLDQEDGVASLDARRAASTSRAIPRCRDPPSARRAAASTAGWRAPCRARAGDAGRATSRDAMQVAHAARGPTSSQQACAPAGAAARSARPAARTGSCGARSPAPRARRFPRR